MTAPTLALIAFLAVILPVMGKAINQAALDQLNYPQMEKLHAMEKHKGRPAAAGYRSPPG